MAISINLSSEKKGEIRRFLEKYYEQEVQMDEDVGTWIYVYNKPLEAIDLISAVVDNNHKYNISVCIEINEGNVYKVSSENHNGVIRDFYNLFYEEI